MGVCIRAYSRMALTPEHERQNKHWCDLRETEDHYVAFTDGFPHSLRGLTEGRCYAPTPDTKTHEILDMSYTGYNGWREELTRAVHRCEPEKIWRNKDTNLALYEIINFSDCEGYIGPDAAADLLADFMDDYLHDRYQQHLDASEDTWVKALASVWDSWITGLRLAVDGGLIRYS